MPSPRSSILILSVLAFILWCAPAQAEHRIALVIGNGAYKTAPLKNPTNDAQDMASALREMGFDVTLKVNVNHRDMEEAVRSFGVKLKQGGLGLFYYAGHGVQVAGENYLIPVDTKVDAEADVKFGALNAGMVLARMEDAGNGLNIVILDACRTNPFSRSFRTAEQGLARMDAPKGSIIAYATAPGRVAADSVGSGRNGVYTGFLLQHMRTPGLKVEEALKRVRADVVRVTVDKQVPWESSSLIGDFYFMQQRAQPGEPSLPIVLTPNQAGLGMKNPKGSTEIVMSEDEQKATVSVEAKLHAAFESMADENALEQARTAYSKKDYATAFRIAKELGERGNVKAQVMLGMLFSQGKGAKKDFAKSMTWYRKAAESGDSTAQGILGTIYEEGADVKQDNIEAAKWFLRSAEQGNAMSQYNLALRYSQGRGVERNIDESVKWLNKAVDQDLPRAQTTLGILYATGDVVQQNDRRAVELFRSAAAQGNAQAQYNLGLLYFHGRGVALSYAEAVNWYRKSAEQGYALAQFNLGAMYASGQGVSQNYTVATSWYRKAAEQGDADAQFNIGLMRFQGKGIPINYVEAAMWLHKSAEQGQLSAQKLLGLMYHEGKGVKKDVVAAYLWVNLAASNGDTATAQYRDIIASEMSQTQLARAQQMARDWTPKNVRQQ